MLKYSTFIIALLFAFAGNNVLCQKNNVVLQSGLFHNFFDKSPLLNVKYPSKYNKLDVFNGLFLNSVGIAYNRSLDSNSTLGLELSIFRQHYRKNTFQYPMIQPLVGWRFFNTVGVNYTYKVPIGSKLNYTFGGGIHYRTGDEGIVINRLPIGEFNGETVYELWVEHIGRNDLGISIFSGIEYSPKKWLTLSTKIDLLSFVYIHDKAMMEKMRDVYDSPQFPSRFDLSLKFGVAYNFNKW